MCAEIIQVVDDHNRCGEGPLWDWRRNQLLWDDIPSSLVFEFDPATGRRNVVSRNLMVAGIALNREDGFVFAGSGIHLWQSQNNWKTILTEHDGHALNINDIVADARGRVYFGTVYFDANGNMLQHGRLYSIDSQRKVQVVDEGYSLANGMGFSPDERTMYATDSADRRIWAYDFEIGTGSLHNKRAFVTVPVTEGLPDGLTVDVDGFVWSAQWYGSQIVRYDPDGRVERRIELPVQQVSSVEFGGADLTDLYVTSAAEAWPSQFMPPSYDPTAKNQGGALFRIPLEIGGKREHRANLR
jgi:sugar lactone lactonase YvrE